MFWWFDLIRWVREVDSERVDNKIASVDKVSGREHKFEFEE